MSRSRIVRGKIIKRTGGDHSVYVHARLVRTAAARIWERGKSGLSYNDLDSLTVYPNHSNQKSKEQKESLVNQACGIEYRDKITCTRYIKQYGPVYWGTLALNEYQDWNILLSANKITTEEKSIIIGMSENEGKLDSVQSYDSEIVTVGAMQKTININGYGELPAQMAAFKSEYPDRFTDLFENCGWEVIKEDKQWKAYYLGATGRELKNRIRKGFDSTKFRKKIPSIPLEPLINAAKDPYFQARQIEDFILRLRKALNETVVKSYHVSVNHVRVADQSFSFKAKDILKSKLGKATLLDHHINRPSYARFDLGSSVKRFFKQHPNVSTDPEDWKDDHHEYEKIILEDYGKTREGTDMVNRFSRMKNNINLK